MEPALDSPIFRGVNGTTHPMTRLLRAVQRIVPNITMHGFRSTFFRLRRRQLANKLNNPPPAAGSMRRMTTPAERNKPRRGENSVIGRPLSGTAVIWNKRGRLQANDETSLADHALRFSSED